MDDCGDADDDNDVNLVRKLLQGYSNVWDGRHDITEMNRVEDRLLDSFQGDQACLVCLECIQTKEPTWSCKMCYELFHLVCIQKWSNQAIQMAEIREEEKAWCCPKCRNEYSPADRPSQYLCYCGKALNPRNDPWLVPHSCGDVCGRMLSDCQHKCLLLCHPGPCPPCPKLITVGCFCGKSKPTARRCGFRGWSCGAICAKKLMCGVHSCNIPCHAGDCEICAQTSARFCLCGKHKTKKLCAEGEWQCNEVCNKLLKCAKHRCEALCHEGDCPPCVRPGSDTCPCGKQKYASARCRDALPCCGDTCGKALDCGFHNCYSMCHRESCPPCTEERLKRCRCGYKEKLMACAKPFLCDLKCKNKRQCGRHMCNRRCCTGNCGACEQVCGRTLNCGKHKCASPCHPAMCYPCPEIAQVTCRCGASVVRVPCGRRKGVQPPNCRKKCSLPADCHHSARQTHKCHFGDCPQCKLVCAIKHESCGHTCPKLCHSAVLTDTNKPEIKPATPWEKPTPKMELVNEPCPPCEVLVSVNCVGGHETAKLPCFRAKPFACELDCGKPLPCGNHSCMLKCHGPDTPCQHCDGLCNLPRPVGCQHPCTKVCHPDVCPPCKQMIRETCHCNINPILIQCCDWTGGSEEERDLLKCCGNQCSRINPCGHRCAYNCHQGPCSQPSDCKKKVVVKCKCGNLQMKVNCHTAATSAPPCDQSCKQAKLERLEQIEAEKLRKRQTETQKSVEERENLERISRGGKRNRRKKDEQDIDQGSTVLGMIRQYSKLIIFLFVLSLFMLLFWLVY